jgi:hypothetical protein
MVCDEKGAPRGHVLDSLCLDTKPVLVEPQSGRERRLGELQIEAERVDSVLVLRRDQTREPRLEILAALLQRPLLQRPAQAAEQTPGPIGLEAHQRR